MGTLGRVAFGWMSVFDIKYEDLEELEFFNKGNFGCLYRAQYFGTDVAVKRLLDLENKAMHKYIEREMCLLKTMRHPSIVQYMGMSKTEDNIFIVTEYVNGGDLYDKLRDSSVNISWKIRVRLAVETCQAVAYLHSRQVVHRDLKSQNLLVDDTWKVKICDFGFARAADPKEYMTLCGTDEWMAPEIMLGEKYDERADIFSLGMIFCELLRRDDPPPRVVGAAESYDVEKFKKTLPEDCPPELVQLALDCTKIYPDDRPDIKEILNRLKALLQTLPDEDFSKQDLSNEMTYMSVEGTDDGKKKKRKKRHKKVKDGEKPEKREKSDEKRKKKNRKSTGGEENVEKRKSRGKSSGETKKKRRSHPKDSPALEPEVITDQTK